ncbi:HAMP domain-containing sensor histidine kinase [Pseudidiomarina sp.]|uniref:sensor histidine kinase n=1 Tax=Pseudidiomarina sp. TaxID=2081707 RepID=UPI00299D798C|nr:HAMP domain-containing sensor histidine kinase [Pseudidiomarina sp.]MDX1705297.1 HAMP domain-containing sensor histidine kinase [Pseudidiomarina sp.]
MDGFSSIKRNFSWLLVLVSSAMVLLGCIVHGTMHINDVRDRLHSQAQNMTQLLMGTASRHLVFNSPDDLTIALSHLNAVPFVQHVHVYRKQSEASVGHFFASYNREGLAPIPSRIDRIQAMPDGVVTLSERYVEIARPIYIGDRVRGYIYLRGSRAELNAAWTSVLLSSFFIVLLAAVLTWMVSLRLRQMFTRPLDEAVSRIQQIARDKDYSIRLPDTHLEELNRLSTAFNMLLGRVQQHINRQQQAEQQASELNAELERQVSQRTMALKESNAELLKTLETVHQYQSQLVEAEKMSSLGDMVAGIAHEVNTPVGLVITSASLLQDKLQVMQQKFDERKVSSQDFERFLAACRENLLLISRNIERTADLITRFRQLAMDQFAEEIRSFNVNTFCEDVTSSLYSRFPELKNHELNMTCAPDLVVSSHPGPIHQIVSQLVQNSLQHAFEPHDKGHISIAIDCVDENTLQLTYQDDGVGIPEDIGRRAFDPFITTKRGTGAAGLGLHLVYNLVTQVLNGRIDMQSTRDEGTTFVIRFPIGECDQRN